MSAFTESALVKKLLDLNSSQQSIQTLSLWLIHHRKHHSNIVKSWFKEMQKVAKNKKLTYMYLANDVIQNSKKKGPEYGREFHKVLLKSFEHIGECCAADEKTISSLQRILNIWEERGVYDVKTVAAYRAAVMQETASAAGEEETSHSNGGGSSGSSNETSTDSSAGATKRKIADASAGGKRHRPTAVGGAAEAVETTVEVNGAVEKHVVLLNQPAEPAGDPPEPEELIKALIDLENSASSDAVVRERIAKLPPDVSEVAMLAKLEDKESALKLATQVNEAVLILHDYNARLCAEMEDRKKLTAMLKDFQAEQRELLAQAEQRVQEYNSKLAKVKDVQKEIRNHLHNLPDLTQLPDVNGGLAPLPSAGDLFNVHS